MKRLVGLLLLVCSVLFGVEAVAQDAKQLLQDAARKSLDTSFIADVEYPQGEAKDIEVKGVYYYRPEGDGKFSTRLDVTGSKLSMCPGKKFHTMIYGSGEYIYFPWSKGAIKLPYNDRPTMVNDFNFPFSLEKYYDFVMGEDITYDGIPCYTIEMRKKPDAGKEYYAKSIFVIGKEKPFIYCVYNYHDDGSALDITKYLHTQFTNVRFVDLDDSYFIPPEGTDISEVTSMEEYKAAIMKYCSPSIPAVTAEPAADVNHWKSVIIGVIIVIAVWLVGIIVYKKLRKK